MGIFKYIGSQFAKPKGFVGKLSTLFMNMLNKQQYASVVKCFNSLKPKNLLDIGFGNGYLLSRLSKNSNANFYGIEISEDMLVQAVKKNKKAIDSGKMKLSIADVSDTKFNSDTFDFIYTVNTVYFWDNLEQGYEEVKRILKNGGVFANAFYTDKWLNSVGSYTKYHFTKYSTAEMIKRIENMGFSDIKLEEISKDKAYCLIAYK